MDEEPRVAYLGCRKEGGPILDEVSPLGWRRVSLLFVFLFLVVRFFSRALFGVTRVTPSGAIAKTIHRILFFFILKQARTCDLIGFIAETIFLLLKQIVIILEQFLFF